MAKTYLVTEDAFHTSYLLRDWYAKEHGKVAIRAERPANLEKRIKFHKIYAGHTTLESAKIEELEKLYGGLSKTEKAMIKRYGIPKLPTELLDDGKTQFVGTDLNSGAAVEWLNSIEGEEESPRYLVFLDRILKKPWTEAFNERRVYNAHSAVLPFAAGMNAIEQVAAEGPGSRERFEKAAGATIHCVDQNIDTGPIIRTKKHHSPYTFNSIWDLKGGNFMLAFELLRGLADELSQEGNNHLPSSNEQELLEPTYKSRDFTEATQNLAEENFLNFKKQKTKKRQAQKHISRDGPLEQHQYDLKMLPAFFIKR